MDSTGAIIVGLDLELIARGRVIATARSTSRGEYDFGQIWADEYQVVVRNSEDWCYPKVKDGATANTHDIYMELCPRVIEN